MPAIPARQHRGGNGRARALLGLDPEADCAWRVLVSNGNYLPSFRRQRSGKSSFNNLLVADLDADLDKLAQIPGASFGTALLRFDGAADQPASRRRHRLQRPDRRAAARPDGTLRTLVAAVLVLRRARRADRKDGSNLRFRQRRSPGSGTGSVAADPGGERAPLHAGVCESDDPRRTPGYYNSALRRHRTVAVSRRFYLSLGGLRRQFGARRADRLASRAEVQRLRPQIGEAGTAWLLGPGDLPGRLRHRRLGPNADADPIDAARCAHSERNPRRLRLRIAAAVARQRGGRRARRVGVHSMGINDSRTMIATRYVGLGVTAFGVIPGRPSDSLGAGIAWSRLNRNRNLRPGETLLQFYDQIYVCGGFYLQPTLTLSPNPGEKTARAPAIAFTVQSTVLF